MVRAQRLLPILSQEMQVKEAINTRSLSKDRIIHQTEKQEELRNILDCTCKSKGAYIETRGDKALC